MQPFLSAPSPPVQAHRNDDRSDVGQYCIRLLVIDRKPLTQGCLVATLNHAALGTIVATESVGAALSLADEGAQFDAVLLNLGGDQFSAASLGEMLAPLRERFQRCAYLLMTCKTDQRSISAALQQGLQAYLTVDHSLEATLDAIRFVCGGWTMYPAISPGLAPTATALADDGRQLDTSVDARGLTPRQGEVLRYLARGMSNKNIASELRISQSTVKAHIKELMLRLGATNRTQIVASLNSNYQPDA